MATAPDAVADASNVPDMDRLLAALLAAPETSDWECSPQFRGEPIVTPRLGFVTRHALSWALPIRAYLGDHGLTTDDVVANLSAQPRELLQGRDFVPAMWHPMYGAQGLTSYYWVLARTRGKTIKLAPPGSGPLFSIAVPRGHTDADILKAKEIAIAEGPIKAAAIATAMSMFAVAGHGVVFGPDAFYALKCLLTASDPPGKLKGRTFYVVGDEGDLAAGHAKVVQAVGNLCMWLMDAGARVKLVRHP